MVRNRMLKILCYRSFKIQSYDKNAELNKCVFIFALKTSTRFIIHFHITLIRSLPLPFQSNSLGEVTLSWKVVVRCFLKYPTTWASSSCFAKITHCSFNLSRSFVTLAKPPLLSQDFQWRFPRFQMACNIFNFFRFNGFTFHGGFSVI